MKEQLISFETAKLAKEMGFNIPCGQFYDNYTDDCEELERVSDKVSLLQRRSHGIYAIIIQDYNNQYTYGDVRINKDACSAPPQSVLQKWLREVHNIIVFVECPNRDKSYSAWIKVWNVDKIGFDNECWDVPLVGFSIFNTYEEALEEGLTEGLKIIH